MSSILTSAIIQNATDVVDSYIQTANSLYDELQGVISTLLASNFNGDAADGYKVFYDTNVVPALTENLTDPGESLTAGIKNLLDNIKTQLIDTVDPQLGENNKNPGVTV